MVFGLAAYVKESTLMTLQSFLSFNNNLQKQLPIKPAPPVTNIVVLIIQSSHFFEVIILSSEIPTLLKNAANLLTIC